MYRHILIPTDGSNLARKGVDHGLALAKALGAEVTIVAVTEILVPYPTVTTEGTFQYKKYVDLQRKEAEKVLLAASESARGSGVEADTVCVENASPADTIIETAEARNCDLIVMSSHGRRGMSRLLLGSVASKVLAMSPVPVLIVR